jgi:hypothetical protein
MNADIQRMSDNLIDEVLSALGLPRSPGWHRLLKPVVHKGTEQLARIGLTSDRIIAEKGFSAAAQWCLSNWCRDILARGREHIPCEGPLLLVSNHPGAYDALVITAQVPRTDLRLIASDLPFLRSLRNASERIFFIPINKGEINQRMGGLLSAIRYLKNGGAVLLMGSGTIDPDPAVYPGAAESLQRWTDAAELFLRFVPQTRVLLTAVSHIVLPQWARHPLTWLQRGGMERRRLAEFGQVLQQLFFPGSLYASPRLSFAPPLAGSDLGDSPRQELIEREHQLLAEHCREFGGLCS